ncbi:Diacylglycerol O-acyltransferase 1, partial [Nowakowskiella sp. JEL0078]
IISVVPLFVATILELKLISYVLVNADLRYESLLNESPKVWEDKASREAKLPSMSRFSISRGTTRSHNDKESSESKYPGNITIHNLIYFALCPTLSYQVSYPMTERFRKAFFAKRAMEFLVASLGMYFLAAQYAGILKIFLLIHRIKFFHVKPRLYKTL